MCKHILNAQASIRAPCCRKWFDVSEPSYCRTCASINRVVPFCDEARGWSAPCKERVHGIHADLCALSFPSTTSHPPSWLCSPTVRPPTQCPECHAESADHQLKRDVEMVFMCKKCKKAFRKDMTVYDEADEYCPHCDNHYVSGVVAPRRTSSSVRSFVYTTLILMLPR